MDSTLVKALARAFRWRKLLEAGVYATIDEMAATARINASYVCRVLRLTLLAPEIVEAILDGRQQAEMTLEVLLNPFPAGLGEQPRDIGLEFVCLCLRRRGRSHKPRRWVLDER